MVTYATSEYLSLGYNCEVAFQIERRFGSGRSFFFNWGIFSIESVTNLLNTKFDGILSPDNLYCDNINAVVMDRLHNYSFHGPWIAGNPLEDPKFLKKLFEYRCKIEYLCHKFLNPECQRVYFYKQQKIFSLDSVLKLADTLQEISPLSTLVLLRSADQPATAARHPIMCERVLTRFAPESDARDADFISWDAVFDEFS